MVVSQSASHRNLKRPRQFFDGYRLNDANTPVFVRGCQLCQRPRIQSTMSLDPITRLGECGFIVPARMVVEFAGGLFSSASANLFASTSLGKVLVSRMEYRFGPFDWLKETYQVCCSHILFVLIGR
jgi:hypothetical protein